MSSTHTTGSRVAIVAARRTAIGTFGGAFAGVEARDLGVAALTAALADAGIAAGDLDEVIAGNILSAGLGQNVARQIALGAGGPHTLPAYTINKVCGSGLKAVTLAAGAVRLGDGAIVAAGGTENMSRAPYALPAMRSGQRLGDGAAVDLILTDALTDAFDGAHMGITAENLADDFDISREAMDAFALESQRRAAAAMEAGRFTAEIAPVSVPQRKRDPIIVATDEHPRSDTTMESLAKLRPAFRPDGGRVTAGNASGINDGAAFLILASEAEVERRGLPVIAWVVAGASAAVDPTRMGYGPVPATKRALDRAGWSLQDVDLAELNEAFAAQSLAVLEGMRRELGGIDPAIVNVNGGAIALGHPVGASGARILVTLLHEMVRRNVKRGLATLCIGGGQGVALLVERD